MAQNIGQDIFTALNISIYLQDVKQLLNRIAIYHDMFQELGVNWNIDEEMFRQLQSFICNLYGHEISPWNVLTDVNLMR